MLPRAALKAAGGRAASIPFRKPPTSHHLGIASNPYGLDVNAQSHPSRCIRTLSYYHQINLPIVIATNGLAVQSFQQLRSASSQSGKASPGRANEQSARPSASRKGVGLSETEDLRSPTPNSEASETSHPNEIDISGLQKAEAQSREDLDNRRTLLADLEKVGEVARLKGDKERVNEVEFLSDDIRRQIDELQQTLEELGELQRIASTSEGYTSKLREENAGTPNSTGSLPDLRQGIPSTFANESSDTSSSFKDQDSLPPELNLTEDPARGGGRRDDNQPREQYVSSTERRRNAIARWLYVAAATFGVAAFGYLGRDWESEAEANSHPEAPSGMSPVAWYHRFRERLGDQFSHYTEPAFPKLLPEPPAEQRMPYTLVLSLEDLLVTSTWTRQDGYKIAKRPGVDYFLRYLCQYYELVIFTSVQSANADLVLRQLDPFQLCLPLFRDSTRYMNGEHVKDLTYLNRDLSRTILIDTVQAHAKLQPENAILLPKWKGSRNDAQTADLVALIPFLEYIAGMELPDVRKVLASYAGTHIPTEFHRREQKAREEFNTRRNAEMARRGRLPGAGLLGGIAGSLGMKPQPPLVGIPGEQTPAEAFAQGKMLSDQLRERGQRGYRELENQIKENGEMWLKMRSEEEKKAQEEGMRNLTGGMFGFMGGPGAQSGQQGGEGVGTSPEKT